MARDGGITVDVSRLLTGLRFPQPTGIERIELGLARNLRPDSGGIALTPIGARGLTSRDRHTVASTAASHWEAGAFSIEEELAPVWQFLRGEQTLSETRRRASPFPLSVLPTLARSVFRSPGSAVRQGGAYLHANFYRLERPDYFLWLGKRPDIKPAFLLFDLLPIQFPQFFRSGEDRLHALRIATAARLGQVLITSAETVAADLRDYLATHNLPTPRIESVGLPVDDIFRTQPKTGVAPDVPPFFIVCGTIEPRKNHRLLLEVWDRLSKSAHSPPKLIIAGRRGWNNREVFDQLDRLGPLSGLVFEAPALSTGALARITAQARGLLSPSFSEGYGLPVAEAMALGVPVIASDCPVYRELWSGQATLIDPVKAKNWVDAILAIGETAVTSGLNLRAPRVMDWARHVQRMEAVLDAS
jgi:glycosyltransferase involved in cell wall biosynthesis